MVLIVGCGGCLAALLVCARVLEEFRAVATVFAFTFWVIIL